MFKDRYQSILLEYEKFWERAPLKRPILNIVYTDPKPGYVPYRQYESLEEKWLDTEYRYQSYKHDLNQFSYLAEGIPMFFANYGPGTLSACIGGGYELSPRTIWFDKKQVIEDWENPPELVFNENSELWQHLLRTQNRFAQDPEVHFSIADLGGVMDILASLRGTENLLYDLYDYPDEVREYAQKVTKIWEHAFDLQVELVRKTGQPFNAWMNIPSAKPWSPIQSDFCYMISPQQFEQFVLPDIVEHADYMDRSIYHLDGVGELPHVDMLLDIPSLNGIQWTSGAACEPLNDPKWFDLYRRIQDKKKNIVLLGALSENDMEGAERLIKSIDPTGVYISFYCSCREKAEEMLEKITRWSE